MEPAHGREKRGFYSTPVVDPETKQSTRAYIPADRAHHLMKFGPVHKYEEMKSLVRDTLVSPDHYCRYRDDDFAGYCFSKAADYAMTNSQTRCNAPTGMVFAVFLTKDLNVADWGWEMADEHNPFRPKFQEGRLESPLWCKTETS